MDCHCKKRSIAFQLKLLKNHEVVFVDGLSVDNTLQIISDFVKVNDPRSIKLISESDNGIYDAMNKGIDIANGEWLYFLGSDDFFYSDTILTEIFNEIKKREFRFDLRQCNGR